MSILAASANRALTESDLQEPCCAATNLVDAAGTSASLGLRASENNGPLDNGNSSPSVSRGCSSFVAPEQKRRAANQQRYTERAARADACVNPVEAVRL